MSNGERNPIVRVVTESSVWRSLFRQPYPTTSRTRALAVMNGVVREVNDEEILEHRALAARYGFGCEPASAATIRGVSPFWPGASTAAPPVSRRSTVARSPARVASPTSSAAA